MEYEFIWHSVSMYPIVLPCLLLAATKKIYHLQFTVVSVIIITHWLSAGPELDSEFPSTSKCFCNSGGFLTANSQEFQ